MSESHAHGGSEPLSYATPAVVTRPPTLTRIGGGLGIAGSCIGLAIFLAGCAGFDAAFKFSAVPVILGGVALVLATVGGLREWSRMSEDTHVMAAVFTAVISVIGGLFEMTIWLGWQTFSK